MTYKIFKHGSYLPMNADSFFLNTLTLSNIQESWSFPVQSVINSYLSIIGRENLSGIYLRGSVAKGSAIDFVSDIDSFALLKTDLFIDSSIFSESDDLIVAQSPFVEHIERICILEDTLLTHKPYAFWRFIVATQSVCLWGNNIIPRMPKYRIDRYFYDLISYDLSILIFQFRSQILFSSFSSKHSLFSCVGIMKQILR